MNDAYPTLAGTQYHMVSHYTTLPRITLIIKGVWPKVAFSHTDGELLPMPCQVTEVDPHSLFDHRPRLLIVSSRLCMLAVWESETVAN